MSEVTPTTPMLPFWRPIEEAPIDGAWAFVYQDSAVDCAYVKRGQPPEDWTQAKAPGVCFERVTHWAPIPPPAPPASPAATVALAHTEDVHTRHCAPGQCKYGDDDCTAAPSLPLAELVTAEELAMLDFMSMHLYRDGESIPQFHAQLQAIYPRMAQTIRAQAEHIDELAEEALCGRLGIDDANSFIQSQNGQATEYRRQISALTADLAAQAERVRVLTEAVEEAKAQAERDCSEAMEERDAFEAQIGRMVASAGLDCEWSSCHDHEDCIEEAFAAQAERVRVLTEAVEEANEALSAIANANEIAWRGWGSDWNGFTSWAQSRARHALARIQSLVGGDGEGEGK